MWLLFAMLRKNKEEPQCLNQYFFTYLTVTGRASVLGLRIDEEDIDKAIEASQGMNYPGYFLLQKVLKRY